MNFRLIVWLLVVGSLVWVIIMVRAPLALMLVSAVILAVGAPIASGIRPAEKLDTPRWLPYAVLALLGITLVWFARWMLIWEIEPWEFPVLATLITFSILPGLILLAVFWASAGPMDDIA